MKHLTKRFGVRSRLWIGTALAFRRSHAGHSKLNELLLLASLVLGCWMLDVGICTGSAQTNAPSKLDYSSYRIISERNIFNPRRSARYTPTTERTRRSAPSRTDSFALVGTMSYEKGLFAFFDGSSPDYRKVLKPEDTIAGFKVTAVAPSSVKLASQTNEIELRIGMQLRHEEERGWVVSERPESTAPVSQPASTSRTGVQTVLTLPQGNGVLSTNNLSGDFPPPDGDNLQPFNLSEPADATATEQPAASTPANDVLERLRRRAAAERGESPPNP